MVEDGVRHWWACQEEVDADKVRSTKGRTGSVNTSVHYYGYCTFVEAVLDIRLDLSGAWWPGVCIA